MKTVCRLALASLLAGALAVAVSARQPEPHPAPGPVMISDGPGGLPDMWFLSRGGPQPARLAEQYVKTEKESEKKELRQKMTEVLSQQFDQHLEHQQKELADLEKQIEELRATLKKRAGAKAAIVDRRVDQLIQDAEGLGWSGPGIPGAFGPGFKGLFHPDRDFRSKAISVEKAEPSSRK